MGKAEGRQYRTTMGEETNDESDPVTGKRVSCPECDSDAFAIIPEDGEIVQQEGDADGKVWVNCFTCSNRFLSHFQL